MKFLNFRTLFSVLVMQIMLSTVYSSILLEKYIYTVKIKNLNVGQSTLKIFEKTINDKTVHQIYAETKTKKIMDVLYKIRDNIILTVDPYDYSLLKSVKEIRQGRHRDNFISEINYDSLKIYHNNSEISIPSKFISAANKIFDPLSIEFNLQKQNFNDRKLFTYLSYNKDEIKNLDIELVGLELVKAPYGNFECYILEPNSESKNNNNLKIWFSNDEYQLPIKIEKISKHGTLTLLLSKYQSYE